MREKQRGMVSLTVTMIMMIVITLIVLGFVEISQNEQRSSLDAQLSAQAYYAAESGINAARAVINKAIAGGGSAQAKTSCGSVAPYTFSTVVDSVHDTAVTCLLVNPTPNVLTATIGYVPTVIPLNASSGTFSSLSLNWRVDNSDPSGCNTALASINEHPVVSGTGAWACSYPMVRVDLYDPSGGLSRATWNANTSTMFFVPYNSTTLANSIAWGSHGSAVVAQCTAAAGCTATITGLTSATYYMRVSTIYQSSARLTISAPGENFVGAQATIDSTGRAHDVLRRILVAVDLTDANAGNDATAGLVVRDTVCKRFSVTATYFHVDPGQLGADGGNPLCDPASNTGSP